MPGELASAPTPAPATGRASDLALENRALADELRHTRARIEVLKCLALQDPLTGLLNRRAFVDAFDALLRQSERDSVPVSLVLLDLDSLKQINDLGGHAAGDEALEALAEQLTAGVRPGDVCARAGGDEFVLGLAKATGTVAEGILERLRATVEAVELGPPHGRLSFSAGIAEFPRDGVDLSDLWVRADAAMYRAKATGRHRSYVSDGAGGTSGLDDGDPIERHRLNVRNSITALARAVDARKGHSHLHSHAVTAYAIALAEALGMDEARVERVREAGVLHDVGAIGVPDTILWKTGPLSEEDTRLIHHHSAVGRDILLGAGLGDIARWIAHLHERFDGGGYPDGLAGEQIPFESRLLAVADALDAMMSPRPHRAARSAEDALKELRRVAGKQFDPSVVACLLGLVSSGELRLRGP